MHGRHCLHRLALVPPLALALVLLGCQASSPEPTTAWRGTVTAEGDTTTVVNEGGSLWGGPARLIEEESLGVAEGADEYMLGEVSALTLSGDAIYVVDQQAVTVRVYDRDGRHLRDVGQSGQGPGEFQWPTLLAVDEASGNLLVLDGRARRVVTFDAVGAPEATWTFPQPRCCVWPMYALGPDRLWAPVQEWIEGPEERRYGAGSIGPDGEIADVLWIPEMESGEVLVQIDADYQSAAPYSPMIVWTPTPTGLLVGSSARYSFTHLRPDGTKLIIESVWERVPVPDEQREWERRRFVTRNSESRQVEWSWDGAEMPEHKPAYALFAPSLTGEMWVIRQGDSIRHRDCAEDPLAEGYREAVTRPCWSDDLFADVFAADGRLLGRVENLPPMPFAAGVNLIPRGDELLALVQDDAGTLMVKRYRLVLPGAN